jgi:hypothetical protein
LAGWDPDIVKKARVALAESLSFKDEEETLIAEAERMLSAEGFTLPAESAAPTEPPRL